MHLLNVKSTMLQKLFDQIAPHYCCSCGEIGSLLCGSCKYDITEEGFSGCLLCGSPSLSACQKKHAPITRSWCGGQRAGGLEELIDRYKFENAMAAYLPLGEILLGALPQLPASTVVVPVPTVRSHVRQRGYDHSLLLARYVAQKQGLVVNQTLRRRTTTVQRGANRQFRILQAKEAFEATLELDETIPYLLIDDVVTTGATMRYAAKTLQSAGARTIWAAAVARQPLD